MHRPARLRVRLDVRPVPVCVAGATRPPSSTPPVPPCPLPVSVRQHTDSGERFCRWRPVRRQAQVAGDRGAVLDRLRRHRRGRASCAVPEPLSATAVVASVEPHALDLVPARQRACAAGVRERPGPALELGIARLEVPVGSVVGLAVGLAVGSDVVGSAVGSDVVGAGDGEQVIPHNVWQKKDQNLSTCEATSVAGCRALKQVSPGIRCFMFHNMELALQELALQARSRRLHPPRPWGSCSDVRSH